MRAKRAAYHAEQQQQQEQDNKKPAAAATTETAGADDGEVSKPETESEKESSAAADDDDNNDKEEEEDDSKPDAAQAAAGNDDNNNKDNDEDAAFRLLEEFKDKKSEPTSMDQAALMEMFQAAGVDHFATINDVPKHLQSRIRSSCFPPTAAEEAKRPFHLERCIRCLPQDNDTGGFFVALLRKTAEITVPNRIVSRLQQLLPRRQVRKQQQQPSPARAHKSLLPKGPELTRRRRRQRRLQISQKRSAPKWRLTRDNKESNGGEIKKAGGAGGEQAVDDDKKKGDAVVDEDKPPRRGVAKGNYCRDENGKALEMGKDDFVPASDEILNTLVDQFGLTASDMFDKDLLMTRARKR